MIYVATVHWRDPKWIETQSAALDRCLSRSFTVFANLEGITETGYDRHFRFVTRDGGPHAQKLNLLAADIVSHSTSADDLLIFLDGDAFPVRPLDDWIDSLLSKAPLAAVRRAENAGDQQPHPCFCVTTVGFWAEIAGDWRPGPTWINTRGEEVTDVGAELGDRLRRRGIRWEEILRTNTRNLHPVMFAIYGGHVYHQGAGFRPPLLRVDGSEEARDYRWLTERAGVRSLLKVRPRHLRTALRGVRQRGIARRLDETADALDVQSERIFREITSSPDFFRQFER